MAELEVSIGRVKREISELVNRVAYGGERVVFTSRGRPKAVLVSLDDYQRLKQGERHQRLEEWETWLAANRRLSAEILAGRSGQPFDTDALWEEIRIERDAHDERLFGR